MSNAQDILAGLRAIVPSAKTVKSITTVRSKRDSLEEARNKVIEKLQRNSAVRRGEPVDGKVDPVYKEQGDGRFAVGIKYGNRYLKEAIAGGTLVPDIDSEQLPAVLDELARQVEEGWYDDAIDVIRSQNVMARNKATH